MGYPTKSGIYKIQNTENGMCYIGQSVNISHRVSQHLSELNKGNHSNRCLQRAWEKYGSSSFHISVVELCDADMLNDREVYYIQQFNTYGSGYNLTTGGDGSPGAPRASGSAHFGAKRVVRLNDGSIYDCIKEASEQTGNSVGDISRCCAGRQFSSWSDKDGASYTWAFYDDYVNMSEDEVARRVLATNREYKNNIPRPVVLLNTGDIYQSAKLAAEDFGIKRKAVLTSCCGHCKYTRAPGGARLIWRYLNDWQRMNETEISDLLLAVANKKEERKCAG